MAHKREHVCLNVRRWQSGAERDWHGWSGARLHDQILLNLSQVYDFRRCRRRPLAINVSEQKTSVSIKVINIHEYKDILNTSTGIRSGVITIIIILCQPVADGRWVRLNDAECIMNKPAGREASPTDADAVGLWAKRSDWHCEYRTINHQT